MICALIIRSKSLSVVYTNLTLVCFCVCFPYYSHRERTGEREREKYKNCSNKQTNDKIHFEFAVSLFFFVLFLILLFLLAIFFQSFCHFLSKYICVCVLGSL